MDKADMTDVKKELRNWNLQKQRICRENAVFVSFFCSF